jgi:hypothetical protein
MSVAMKSAAEDIRRVRELENQTVVEVTVWTMF